MAETHCDITGHVDTTPSGTDSHAQIDCHHPDGSGWSGYGNVHGNGHSGNHYDLGGQYHFNDHWSAGGNVGWGAGGNSVNIGGSYHW